MGLLSFFQKKPEDLANNGHNLFNRKQYAQAIREYEKALDRYQKHPVAASNFEKTISDRIHAAKKALAEQHLDTATALMESKCFNDAKELLNLSLELTDHPSVQDTAKKLLEDIQNAEPVQVPEYIPEYEYDDMEEDSDDFTQEDFDDNEYAYALINSLPEDEQEVYQSYGQAFIRGYVALNQGDFERAADYLQMALQENQEEKTYIPLELGTCYLNMGKLEAAKDLLSAFILDYPLSSKGYQILCETLWGLNEHDQALELLKSCPEELSDTALMVFLTGQTLTEAGKADGAVALFNTYLKENSGDDMILRALGNTYEKTGEVESAQKIYAGLMNACTSCGRPADLELKKRYAETSFEIKEHTLPVLELYLELASKDPEQRSNYYKKISVIYNALGNEDEARRFEAFAKKALR